MRVTPATALCLLALSAAACPKADDTSPSAPSPSAAAENTAPSGVKRVPVAGYSAYDPTADGQAQVASALAEAKRDNKRVLVMFGGNWCRWCRALDGVFSSDPAVRAVLAQSYVVVHIDSDTNAALNTAWNNPFALGFPVLVILDADGVRLHTQETGSLESADKSVSHDPEKLLLLLRRWAPTRA